MHVFHPCNRCGSGDPELRHCISCYRRPRKPTPPPRPVQPPPALREYFRGNVTSHEAWSLAFTYWAVAAMGTLAWVFA